MVVSFKSFREVRGYAGIQLLSRYFRIWRYHIGLVYHTGTGPGLELFET